MAYVYVCIQSAAASASLRVCCRADAVVAAACCCCCLLLLPPFAAAVRHRTPATRDPSCTQQYSSTVSLFYYDERKYLMHPLAVQSLLCDLGFPILYTSHGHYGRARSRARASAHRGEAPLVHTSISTYVLYLPTYGYVEVALWCCSCSCVLTMVRMRI